MILKYELTLFLTAVQFFTRLPVPRWVGHSNAQLNDASRYFPLVGVLIGLICAATLYGANQLFPFTIAVALSMMAGILATGAFHEDGLADSCDGFGGGWEKPQVLAIMKDSRLGTYGALGLGMVLGLKFLALCAMPLSVAMAAMIAAHALSRFLAVTVIYTQSYVRDDDSARAKPAAQSISSAGVLFAALFGLAPVMVFIYVPLMSVFALALIVAACVAVRVLLGRYFIKRIGGYTGDCLGFMQQICEVVFYLGAVIAVKFSINA